LENTLDNNTQTAKSGDEEATSLNLSSKERVPPLPAPRSADTSKDKIKKERKADLRNQ